MNYLVPNSGVQNFLSFQIKIFLGPKVILKIFWRKEDPGSSLHIFEISCCRFDSLPVYDIRFQIERGYLNHKRFLLQNRVERLCATFRNDKIAHIDKSLS